MPKTAIFGDPTPEQVLAKYGIVATPGSAVTFSPPSGTYPGRSYEAFSQAYSAGAKEYADALARQAAQKAKANTAATVTPTIAPTIAPTATGTTGTPTTTTVGPVGGIATPQINYTPANNADYIRSMSDLINQINQDAQRSANAGRIPMAGALEAQSSKNIQSALQGILPEDVQYQIAQRAAERGVGRGSPMGASTTADLMRALGLTSLQLQGTGQEWLTGALGRNPAAPIFDPTKLLITPGMATEFGLRQGEFDLNKLQLDLQTQLQRDQQQLQRDLANASNQLERDRLIWQFQQNELNRENALRIAQMEAQARQRNYAPNYGQNWGGAPGGASAPAGGFNLNWPNFQQPTQGKVNPVGQFTPGTSTDPMSPMYGYTTQPGYPNTAPGASPWQAPSWDFNNPLPDMTNWGTNPQYDYNFGQGDINMGDLSPDELISLYSGGY